MLKWIVGVFFAKQDLASIVSSLESTRSKLLAHVGAKQAERDAHYVAAAESDAKAAAAHSEVEKADQIAANIGNLLAV